MGERIRPTLCVDFDGVLHSYTSGWQGADVIADDPVPNSKEFLKLAIEHFEVAIYSSRSSQIGGIGAMKRWMYAHYGPEIAGKVDFPTTKPAAFMTIDDRAFCFKGDFPHPVELLSFKPWNKK